MSAIKAVIIYQTTYGHNREASMHMAKSLRAIGHEADCHNVHDILAEEVKGADLYLFCSPTHIGRPPRKMRSLLKAVSAVQRDGDYALVVTRLPEGEGGPRFRTTEMMEGIISKGHMRHRGSLELECVAMSGPLEEGWGGKLDSFLASVLAEML